MPKRQGPCVRLTRFRVSPVQDDGQWNEAATNADAHGKHQVWAHSVLALIDTKNELHIKNLSRTRGNLSIAQSQVDDREEKPKLVEVKV